MLNGKRAVWGNYNYYTGVRMWMPDSNTDTLLCAARRAWLRPPPTTSSLTSVLAAPRTPSMSVASGMTGRTRYTDISESVNDHGINSAAHPLLPRPSSGWLDPVLCTVHCAFPCNASAACGGVVQWPSGDFVGSKCPCIWSFA